MTGAPTPPSTPGHYSKEQFRTDLAEAMTVAAAEAAQVSALAAALFVDPDRDAAELLDGDPQLSPVVSVLRAAAKAGGTLEWLERTLLDAPEKVTSSPTGVNVLPQLTDLKERFGWVNIEAINVVVESGIELEEAVLAQMVRGVLEDKSNRPSRGAFAPESLHHLQIDVKKHRDNKFQLLVQYRRANESGMTYFAYVSQ
jgi:hypothetical protein